MKSVLISIQPKWCELISKGKKTVEVRKTKPKLETPFKVYIYCTANKKGANDLLEIHGTDGKIRKANCKVIGEFICDKIYPIKVHSNCAIQNWNWYELSKSCLTFDDVAEYIGVNKTGYGWHVSNLVIYDTPKELSEFAAECRGYEKPYGCDSCEYYYIECNESVGKYEECCCETLKPLTRPPQSWCYVYHPTEKGGAE